MGDMVHSFWGRAWLDLTPESGLSIFLFYDHRFLTLYDKKYQTRHIVIPRLGSHVDTRDTDERDVTFASPAHIG